jgi:predicted dehydrogenase
MKLRVGVVGCGIGREHVSSYAQLPDLFQVRAVCDLDEARARALAAEAGAEAVTTDFAALCGREDLDVIDVCTPSHLHAPQALQALAAGKHVICEKPVAGSLKQADALAAAEARSGRRLMPIFQNRFGPEIRRLKRLIDSGAAGRAYLLTAETAWRRRPVYYEAPWRGKWATEMGGALVTLGIHMLDLVLHLGGPVKVVSARCATMVNPIETEDNVAATLGMADGSLCVFSVTTGSPQEQSRMHLCREGLSAESGTSPYSYVSEPWRIVPESPEWDARITDALRDFSPGPDRFAGQFKAFHEALSAGAPPPVTIQEARAVLEVITAIYASAGSGGTVALPIASGEPCYADWRPPVSRG